VGKTALAVQWAHTVRDRFRDGQLYVELRGFATVEPLRPVDALAGFLVAMGVPAERVPASEDQAAALYRTLLAGRKVLVVLDNARDPAQVRPLLPGGPGGMVLVTSRGKLGGLVAHDGAGQLSLDVMERDESEALLARTVARDRPDTDPDALARLARLCAYLPLALRIAAANLTMYPKRSVADHLAALGADNRLGALAVRGADRHAVRAAFDLSYACLDPAARRLFRCLGILPGADFTAEDAAAVLGDVDPATADELLARLADAHLIDERDGGRYGCHDLLRLYAAERAAAEEPTGTRATALAWLYAGYVRRARAAADLLYPHMLRLPGAVREEDRFPDEASALAWLEAERRNLVLAVRHAADHGPRPAGWMLADALRGYFHLRRYSTDWFAVAGAALTAARHDGDLAGQAAARHSLGTAYRSVGEHPTALHHYVEALRLARRVGWPESEATTLGNLGIVSRKLGRLGTAARWLEAGLALDRRLGRRAGEANNLGLLAFVYQEMGRLSEAAEHFTAALALNTEIGSRHGEALMLTGLGQVDQELGRYPQARHHLIEAVCRYADVGDRDGAAMVHCGLSLVDQAEGRLASARSQALAALALARETGDRHTEAIARNALGTTETLRGEPGAAIAEHRRAHALAEEIASRRLASEAMIGLAMAHLRFGDLHRAADLAGQALDLAEHGGFEVVVGMAHDALAGIHHAAGHAGRADAHAEEALASRGRSGHGTPWTVAAVERPTVHGVPFTI
jgi:tetratricopeptide (TPR) repeat protein